MRRAIASAAFEYEAEGSAGTPPFEARESLNPIRGIGPKPGPLTEHGSALAERLFSDGVQAPLLGSLAWLTALQRPGQKARPRARHDDPCRSPDAQRL